MDFMAVFRFLQSLWIVWVAVLFTGIVAYAFWPKNKAKFDGYASMALRDDDKP